MSTKKHPTSLGQVLRGIRFRNNWTLKEMSEKTGIPVSTLSKVEHDRLTLGYDKLLQISQRLKIRMSDLFAEEDEESVPAVMGRRSIGTRESAARVTTQNYDYFYLFPDLRKKSMIPILSRIRAKSAEEFGELIKHEGEEFIFVVEGKVDVHTEFYDPVTLNTGEGMYLDSTMGHAFVTAEGCEEALIIGACYSPGDDPLHALKKHHMGAGRE